MTTRIGRASFLFCLCASPLWAGPVTEVNTGRTTTGNTVNTGLPGAGGAVTGNASLGSITQPQQISISGSVKTVTPAPTVNPTNGASSLLTAPVSVINPQTQAAPATPRQGQTVSPQAQSPAALPTGLTRSVASPQTQTPGVAAGLTGFGPQERADSKDAAPGAASTLDGAVAGIQAGAQAEAKGMGEGAVRQALDHIFDVSHAGMGQGPTGVAGSAMQTEEKIKKTVSIANTSSPRDAPGLYASAIQTAQDSFPARIAGLIKEKVLGYAAQKAATALPEVANSAYAAAAVGSTEEVQKAFKTMDRWESLLGAPGRPLVANSERLKADIVRVQEAAAQAASEGRKLPAPRIWFARAEQGFSAVLPTASVVQVPLSLAESLALKDAVAPAPFYQQALLAFQARPTMANGFKLVYQANRQERHSAVASAYASASYAAKTFLARIWNAVKGFVLRVLGRGPDAAVSRGFSVEASAEVMAKLKAAPTQTASLGGAHWRVAKVQASAPAWSGALTALAQLEAEQAMAAAMYSRSTPLDLSAARALLGLAAAMAGNYGVISRDDSAAVVVQGISRRFEAMAKAEGLGPRAPLTPAMSRLISEPEGSLRTWMSRMRQSGQDLILALPGRAPVNLLVSRDAAGNKQLALADLGESASVAKGRIESPALRAAARTLLDAPSSPAGSFIVNDRQLLARWGIDGRYGKVYAYVAPTDAGGLVRLRYEDASGAAQASRLLTALGFAVEADGKSLSAALDADAGALSGDEVAEALSRAVNILQNGRDPGSRGASAARREAASGVAKLVSDLKTRRAAAAQMAATAQALVPASLRFSTIGRVGALLAQSGRQALDDGRSLSFYRLQDPDTGLSAFARVELEGKVLSAAELRALLPPQ